MNQKEPFDGKISIIPLETEKGRKLLAESLFNRLVPYSVKQNNLKYCGPCSIAICVNEILNSQKNKNMDPYDKMNLSSLQRQEIDGNQKVDEDQVCALGKNSGVIDNTIDKHGITLRVFADIVRTLNCDCVIGYALEKQGNKNVGSYDEFRSVLLELFSTNHHIVINFDLRHLGYYQLKGHFSPLGGINLKEDRVLVLDTWPSVPASWIKIKDLFNAMATLDEASGESRGFCAFRI